MKKLFLIFLLLVPIILAEEMEPLETITYEGREITLNAVQGNKALISVDGEKNILSLNQQKTINGVKITLIEIFDAGDFGTANLDFELAYNCGDLKCDEFETSENCCKDCGCSGALKCVENSCILPECTLDSQCEDSNSLTEDYCSEFKCKHRNIKCEKDLDCNDNNLDTDDTCYKGNCRNFLNYVCKTNEDCEDQNPCTTDLCVNKDCQNTLKENCEFESEPEKTVLEKQNEEIKNNLEEDVKKLRENVLTKVLSWFKNLFN